MITLRDAIDIKTDAAKLFEWFADLPKHYAAWHPDHVVCRFDGTEMLRPGARIYIEEYLHGRLHKLRFRISRVIPHSRIEYRIGPALRGAFITEEVQTGTRFTAELKLGVKWPILGPLLDRVLIRLFPRKIAAIRDHMREEGESLKRIMEEDIPSAGSNPGQ